MINIEVSVDSGIQDLLARAKEAGTNLTIPFTSIAKSWFKSNRSIFTLQGPGQYPDYGGLSPNTRIGNKTRAEVYRQRKQKKFGFVYPMMRAVGNLERSLTDATNPYSINLIINKVALYLGTRIPYAPYHQADGPRKKLPFRPIVFLGAEQLAPSEKKAEYNRITQILDDAIQSSLNKAKDGI